MLSSRKPLIPSDPEQIDHDSQIETTDGAKAKQGHETE